MFLILGYFIVISFISSAVCYYDKQMAVKGKRRISEKALFLISLLGGSVAMYFTMHLIRHKTRHIKFMIGLPLIIVLQIAVIFLILKNIG